MLIVHIDAYNGECSSQVARLTMTRQGAAATLNDYKVTFTEFDSDLEKTFTIWHQRSEGALVLLQRCIEESLRASHSYSTPLEALIQHIENYNGSKLKFERGKDGNGWNIEFEYDRTTITARGESLEAALVEAITTRSIADINYYDVQPAPTPEQMNKIHNEWHLHFLGRPAPRPYQGEYAEGWQP